jgi:hypothetical protein
VVDYMVRREDAARMNDFLQTNILMIRHNSCPKCAEMLPQSDYIFFEPPNIVDKYALKDDTSQMLYQHSLTNQSNKDSDEAEPTPYGIHVLRLERLHEDFAELAEKIQWDVPIELPNIEVSLSRDGRCNMEPIASAWISQLWSAVSNVAGWSLPRGSSSIADLRYLTFENLDNATLELINKRYASDFTKLKYDKIQTNAVLWAEEQWNGK